MGVLGEKQIVKAEGKKKHVSRLHPFPSLKILQLFFYFVIFHLQNIFKDVSDNETHSTALQMNKQHFCWVLWLLEGSTTQNKKIKRPLPLFQLFFGMQKSQEITKYMV